jgi:pimeloyl-ACP methyl ester carboxylesterase
MQATAVGLAVAVTVAAAACGPQGPIARARGPVQKYGNLTLRPIDFATTDFYVRPTVVQADEGWLRVPRRHDGHGSDSLTLHFVRFPSTAETPGAPIVYLAGGPGGSAIQTASEDRFNMFMRLRAIGDVIALDQRGVDIVCPGSWSYPLDRPLAESTLARILHPYLRSCASTFADSLDLTAFNTVENAEDLDDLREALGADRVSLVAISYGTHLALTYMRRHPDRVRRATLHGIEGPGHTWKSPAEIDRVLWGVDSAMAAAVQTLVTMQPEMVVVDNVSVTVGADDLRRAVFFAIRRREDIAEIPGRLRPMLRGDYTPLARWALRTRRQNREQVMAISMDCASGVSPARRDRIEREALTAIVGDIANMELRVACAAWPSMDLGPRYRMPVQSDVPVLFVSGTLDARTPVSQAREVMAGFPNGRELVLEGAGHDDDLFLFPGVVDAMVAFLTGAP